VTGERERRPPPRPHAPDREKEARSQLACANGGPERTARRSPGMLWREPTFGLSPEEEGRYRASSLAADLTQARIVIPLILAATLAFAVNDYAFFGPSWPFYGLSILRLSLVAGGVLLLRYVRTLSTTAPTTARSSREPVPRLVLGSPRPRGPTRSSPTRSSPRRPCS